MLRVPSHRGSVVFLRGVQPCLSGVRPLGHVLTIIHTRGGVCRQVTPDCIVRPAGTAASGAVLHGGHRATPATHGADGWAGTWYTLPCRDTDPWCLCLSHIDSVLPVLVHTPN